MNHLSTAESVIKAVSTLPADITNLTSTLGNTLGGAQTVKERYRSLKITIKNNTDYTLDYAGTHFDSGTNFDNPKATISGKEVISWYVANRQGSVLTGVTGGNKYFIKETKLALFIGYCNPTLGCFKTYITVDSANKSNDLAYQKCSDDHLKSTKENGFHITAEMTDNDTAMKEFIFTISK